MTRSDAEKFVGTELDRAVRKYPPMNSPHEGFALLLEEVDELWDEVKKKPKKQSKKRMLEEAAQIGALAVRFIIDCCREEG